MALSIFDKGKNSEEKFLSNFIRSKFGYRVKDIDLFLRAVTHKSLLFEDHSLISNERLEFLGDAVIDTVIAEYLFIKFPNEAEGYLTKVKSKVVSRKHHSEIAESIGINAVIRYQKGRSINMSTIEGNAYEAIIGAIFLDGGFKAASAAIQDHILVKYVNMTKVLEEEIDFKSKLFIWCQKGKLELQFDTVTEENQGGFWKYTMMVIINKKKYGMGTGSSKKLAEQAASKETLELMGVI
ncbi:MAG: ribonuclease III [Bacteroidota bacterium]